MRFLLLAGLLCTGATAAPRLVSSADPLPPDGTIQILFDDAAVADGQVGKKVAAADWLDIRPEWKGKLLWEEPTLARFIPATAPEIGANYRFKLKPDLKHADGSAIPADELAVVSTQNFSLDFVSFVHRYHDDWSPRTATMYVRFNADVDPGTAAGFLQFRDSEGATVAAKVERPTYGRLNSSYFLAPTWNERFLRQYGNNPPQGEPTPETRITNGLLVSPAHPLPVGKDWNLIVREGLPDAAAVSKLPASVNRFVATIQPFAVESATARVVADQPRRIVVDFNHRLPAAINKTQVSVFPEPADAKFEVRGDELHVLGDFSGDRGWRISIDPAFASHDGLALGAGFEEHLAFRHLDPALALPSQSEAQLATGSRTYPIDTLNLASVKIRVKRLTDQNLIRAQQGYRFYTGIGPNGKPIKPTHPLPYEMLVGETVGEYEIPFANPLDTTQRLTLDWDALMAADPQPWRLGKADDALAAASDAPATYFVEVVGTPRTEIPAPDEIDDYGNPVTVKAPMAQALVQLTDIGLAWKIVDDEARIFAFSCLTGEPLPGVRLATYGEDAKPLQDAVTGADGTASLPREAAARTLEASHLADRYTVAYDTAMPTVGLWRFPVRYSWGDVPLVQRRVFLFSDRSLYRPGETVKIKGIVRRQDGNRIESDPAAPAQIAVADAAGREFLRRDAEVSEAGGFDLSFELPDEQVGHFRIVFEYPAELEGIEEMEDWTQRRRIEASARFAMGIRVEEFRRNAFEIVAEAPQPAVGAGEVALHVKAAYFQGQPVAKGEVEHFSNITERNFYPDGFRDHLFGDHRQPDYGYWYHYFGYRWEDNPEARGTHASSDQAELSEDGTATISVTLPESEFPMKREVTITTQITDANRQTLGETTTITVHPSDFHLGVSRTDRLVRVGDEIPLNILAVAPDGSRWTGPLQAEVAVSREFNDQVRIAGDHGASSVRNEARLLPVSSSAVGISPDTGGSFAFVPKETGLHQIEVRAKDGQGRPVVTITSIHVYGGKEYPWAYEDGMRIKLVPEKKIYQPGETARILVLSPIEGTALVTLEREKILRTFMVPLTTDKPVIEIPLSDDEAPNTFVSVLVIKGAKESARDHKEPQLRLGYCELTVENRRDRLDVALEVPQESVRPGDDVEITGTAVLADGTPAAGAEVTLYAGDEGTLAVMGYRSPDPMAFFYDPRELRVDCGTSLDRFIPEDPAAMTFYNKGFFIGGGDGDPFSSSASSMRRDFNPSAGWKPALETGADGRFTATFRMPDTLTRYRVIAIAHHGASRFGSAEAPLTVNKPLMIVPQAPRFANQNDLLHVRALVQNNSEHDGVWKIDFKPNPPASEPIARLADGGGVETLTLAAGESASVVFPVEFTNTGEAVLAWSATPVSLNRGNLDVPLTVSLSDAVEARFPVAYPVPLIRQEQLISLGGRSTDVLAGLNRDLLEGAGQLDLEFSRSLLMEAAGSADFLLQYPYGCLEQTTSSMMPWLAVEPLRGVVPSLSKQRPEQVRTAIQRGVNRLLSMQQRNGGFSYWPSEREAVDWATGYAGLGLMLARESGASVSGSSLVALGDYLETGLRGAGSTESTRELENACLAVWVLALAERGADPYINTLRERMADLTPRARCLLALAAHTGGMEGAAGILRDKTEFKHGDPAWMRWNNDDAVRLLAWSEIEPKAPETLVALEQLLKTRGPAGHWHTTWANAWTLLAMASYAEHETALEPANVTLVTADGPQTIAVDAKSGATAFEFPLNNQLALSAESDHPTYVRVRLASKPAVVPQMPVARNGLRILRTYARVNADGTTVPLDVPKLGDLVRITLEVTLPSDQTRYLVVEDRLPAIFEAVNEDFASQSAGPRPGAESDRNWQISHREIRSDRALFFYNHIWHRGTQKVSYLARCTMEGKAFAPPAKVEEMYDPENTALSASRQF